MAYILHPARQCYQGQIHHPSQEPADTLDELPKVKKSEPHIKDQLSAAVRKVAVMDKATNRLKLKDGF